MYNTKWNDLITNDELHKRANIPEIAERLDKLKDRADNTFHDNHLSDIPRQVNYKFSEHQITTPPINNPSNGLIQCYRNLTS